MPKVSIIMATYNCEKTLRRSIDSILAQTFNDWEFVICDDCSADGTLGILREYAECCPDKFVILVNEKNSKLSYSLNRCLAVSKGEYIARMDGDDESCPERLQKQVDFLDAHPEYEVVGTAMIPFDEQGEKPIRYAIEEPVPRDMVGRSPFFHATIMMRKEAYDAVGGYTVSARTVRAQDYDMWFRFFAQGMKGYSLQEGLYRVLEDGAALKRRTLKTRTYEVQTKLMGYKMLHFPWYVYPRAFKPVIAALMPNVLMSKYHEVTDERSKRLGTQG